MRITNEIRTRQKLLCLNCKKQRGIKCWLSIRLAVHPNPTIETQRSFNFRERELNPASALTARRFSSFRAATSLPSLRVHQAVLALRLYQGVPVRNSDGLRYFLLLSSSAPVLTQVVWSTHRRTHRPQWPGPSCWSCWSLQHQEKEFEAFIFLGGATLQVTVRKMGQEISAQQKVWICGDHFIWRGWGSNNEPKWLKRTCCYWDTFRRQESCFCRKETVQIKLS